MAEEFGYEKLEVWQLAMQLVDKLYVITRSFPNTEIYGLAGQMRRAAVSVASNLAEGYGRGTRKAFASAARISRGSLFELRTQMEIAHRQQMIAEETYSEAKQDMVLLSRKLDRFVQSLEIDRVQESHPEDGYRADS